jgi:hypothetical protein
MDEVTNAVELVCTEQKGRTLREMVTALITKFLQAKMKHAKTSVALYSTTVEDSKKFFMREVYRHKIRKVEALRFGRIPDRSRGRRRRPWRRCSRRSRSPVFFTIMLALLHRLLQFFLVIGQQSMNLAVRFIADSVNLRAKLLPRSVRILIKQRLNPVVVRVKQRPDLLLLFRGQLQIFPKPGKFLVNRLRRMDMLKLLTR